MISSDDRKRMREKIQRVAGYVTLNEEALLACPSIEDMVELLETLFEGKACRMTQMSKLFEALEGVNFGDAVRFNLKISVKDLSSTPSVSASEESGSEERLGVSLTNAIVAKSNPQVEESQSEERLGVSLTNAMVGKGDPHSGVIKSIDSTSGCVSCEYVKELCGADVVFLSESAPPGCKIGDSVEFELISNQRDQFQAKNLRLQTVTTQTVHGNKLNFPTAGEAVVNAPKVISPAQLKEFLNGASIANSESKRESMMGVIKSVNARFGFIECEELRAEYGCDVSFLSSAMPSGCRVGDSVVFDMMLKNARPQASNLRKQKELQAATIPARRTTIPQFLPKGITSTRNIVFSNTDEADHSSRRCIQPEAPFPGMKRDCGFIDSQEYTGVISVIDKKLAFIQCAKIRSQYGFDVFCSPHALNDRSVGDTVSFDLRLNAKRQPQAHNIRDALVQPSNSSKRQNKKQEPQNSQCNDGLGVTTFTHSDEITRTSANDKSDAGSSRALLKPRGSIRATLGDMN